MENDRTEFHSLRPASRPMPVSEASNPSYGVKRDQESIEIDIVHAERPGHEEGRQRAGAEGVHAGEAQS